MELLLGQYFLDNNNDLFPNYETTGCLEHVKVWSRLGVFVYGRLLGIPKLRLID